MIICKTFIESDAHIQIMNGSFHYDHFNQCCGQHTNNNLLLILQRNNKLVGRF